MSGRPAPKFKRSTENHTQTSVADKVLEEESSNLFPSVSTCPRAPKFPENCKVFIATADVVHR